MRKKIAEIPSLFLIIFKKRFAATSVTAQFSTNKSWYRGSILKTFFRTIYKATFLKGETKVNHSVSSRILFLFSNFNFVLNRNISLLFTSLLEVCL